MEKLNVLITGSSSGFGLLMAKTLSKDGHRVFASMRNVDGKNADAAYQLKDWARSNGVNLEVVDLDVTLQSSVDTAATLILESAGYIDVVINNAGATSRGPLEAFSIEQMQAMFDLNAFGPMRVDKAFLPTMRERRSGLIIHVTSTMGRILSPTGGLYAASKFAMEALAESLNSQLAIFGIDAVIVEPGAFPTGVMNKPVITADGDALPAYESVTQQRPRAVEDQDPPDPQDIADAIKKLIDMPAGTRPLRTVVGTRYTAGVEALNEAYEISKKQMWESLGFVPRPGGPSRS